MQLWLDTADITAIEKAKQSGLLYGVTTNPSIFSAANKDFDQLLTELLSLQEGLVAVQVTKTESIDQMVAQALALSKLCPARIVVKIPSTPTGFAAMHQLKKKNVLVLATAISTITQYIAAATVGADYGALYLSHMQSSKKDIFAEIKTMLALAEKNCWTINLMGAAFADTATAQQTMAAGVGSVTVPDDIFDKLFNIEPEVAKQLEKFKVDWRQYQQNHKAGILSTEEASPLNAEKRASQVHWLNQLPPVGNTDCTSKAPYPKM
jgi:fructose-6-phosphate aldolase 1